MIDWHWEVFFYYKLKRWGCELTVSQTPTFIIEPFFIRLSNMLLYFILYSNKYYIKEVIILYDIDIYTLYYI